MHALPTYAFFRNRKLLRMVGMYILECKDTKRWMGLSLLSSHPRICFDFSTQCTQFHGSYCEPVATIKYFLDRKEEEKHGWAELEGRMGTVLINIQKPKEIHLLTVLQLLNCQMKISLTSRHKGIFPPFQPTNTVTNLTQLSSN